MAPNMPKMAQNTKIITTLKSPFYCCAAVAPIRSLIALVIEYKILLSFFSCSQALADMLVPILVRSFIHGRPRP